MKGIQGTEIVRIQKNRGPTDLYLVILISCGPDYYVYVHIVLFHTLSSALFHLRKEECSRYHTKLLWHHLQLDLTHCMILRKGNSGRKPVPISIPAGKFRCGDHVSDVVKELAPICLCCAGYSKSVTRCFYTMKKRNLIKASQYHGMIFEVF